MERKFTNENFERFLRQNSDGLRMRPSEKVWQGISKNLNRGRRRLGFFLAFLILATTGTAYYVLENGSSTNNHAGQNISAPVEGSSVVKTELGPRQLLQPKQKSTVSESIPSTALRNHQTSGSYIASIPGTAEQLNSIASPFTFPSQEEKVADLNVSETTTPIASEDFQYTVVDSYSEEVKTVQAEISNSTVAPADPMSIESIINAYRRKNKRFGMQFYFTPTISYRHLSDDHIDKVVTHKPYFGFEVGLTSKYAIASNVKLKAGFQFNINRYGIKTNKSTEEFVTFHLNGNNGTDSLTTITGYNNESGYRSDWLQNFYFQASMPVGVEVKLKGDKDVEFGIASTIQPTYVIGDRAYLITNDYKKYAEVPRLIRRWNINTSLETFVAYSTGRLKWQVGPQVRYQLLSSFDKTYPVKENLFDFGLKVGISLNNQ